MNKLVDVPMLAESGVVGRSVPHESAHLHVTGAAPYTDDIPELHGTLHAAVGMSPVAHGKLKGFDFAAIRAMTGVIDVITHEDIPGRNECGAVFIDDDKVLAEGTVRFFGQPVFAVIATTREAARRAAALAKGALDIEPLEPVLTARAAHARGEYVIPAMNLSRNTSHPDTATALAAAKHRIKRTLEVGGQEQFYLEGQISYAVPREDDGLLVYCSTQHPSEMQHAISHVMGLSANQVQVVCRRMGGGFGGKETQAAMFACMVAIAARKLNRPVKLRVDRDDDFLITGRRHGYSYDFEAGFDDDGRITAAEVTMISNAGHSADVSGPVMTRAVCNFDGAYWLPEVSIHGHSARTNTQSNTAFRGFGGPQGAIAIESIMDTVARQLGKDPLEVRRVNFYGKTERNVAPYGEVIRDNVIHELTDQLIEQCDYKRRRAEIQSFNKTSRVLKKGIAYTPLKFGISFNVTMFNQAGALVHVYTDGSILANHGGTEMGQGLNTKVRMIVAHELGVGVQRVRCTATDTDKVVNTSATAASTGGDLNGKAAQDAARQIRDRLATFAAKTHGGDAAEVRFGNDQVFVNGKTIAFADLVMSAYADRVQLWSDGFYKTPGLSWDMKTCTGHPFYYYAYGGAVSEVVVDTLTGEWKALRSDLLQDVGRSMNPAVDIGQVEGGFIQGMGWMTMEELMWHPTTGMLMTHAPSTYKIPTANDAPLVFNAALFENENIQDSIHRSKACGEPPLLLPFSVFFAIRDAISAVGDHKADPPLSVPATSEEILRAIDAVRS